MWGRRLVTTKVLLVLFAFAECGESRKNEPKIITEPRPGEEYVFFQKGSPRFVDPNNAVKNDTNLLDLISGSLLRPKDHLSFDETPFDISDEHKRSTQSPAEVQTEVSVVTSRAVYVDGPLVVPESQTGVIKDASNDEAAQRKVAPKMPTVTLNPTLKKFQDAAFDTSEVRNVRVHLESSDGVIFENAKLLPGDVGVPIQHHPDDVYSLSSNADITTYHPTTLSPPTTVSWGSTLTTTEVPYSATIRDNKSIIGGSAENSYFGKDIDNSDFKFGDKGSPLDDKLLVPAETAQATRVNIKKAPNGKEYEYEYVYYYYDDDDDAAAKNVSDTSSNDVSDVATAAAGASPVSNAHDGPGVDDIIKNKNSRAFFGTEDVDAPDVEDVQTTSSPTTTTAVPVTTVPTTTPIPSPERQGGGRRYLPNVGSANKFSQEDASIELRAPPSRSRDYIRVRDSSVEVTTEEAVQPQYQGRKHLSRGRHHQSTTVSPPEPDIPVSGSIQRGGAGRYRYTSIERNRGAGSSKEEQDNTFDSERGSANDVLPSRGGSRFTSSSRARQPISSSSEEVSSLHSRDNSDDSSHDISEERLPQVTRFPARRPNPTVTTAAVSNAPEQTREIIQEPFRSQSSPHVRGGAVRPSLELIDSSSFRTSAGPGGPIPSLHGGFLPAFPSVPGGPGASVRFLGVNPEDFPHSSPAPFQPHLIPLVPDDETAISHSTAASPPSVLSEAHAPYFTPRSHHIEDTESTTSTPAEKSVYDLYAILKAQENSVDSTSATATKSYLEDDEEISTESITEDVTTTLQPTTTTTTATTTTSTTPAPTTTQKSGRTRGRSRPGSSSPSLFSSGARTRTRRPSSGTTTTEATGEEHSSTSRPRGRFQSSRNGGLSPSRGSSFRRTTTVKPEDTESDAQREEQESSSSRPLVRPGNRFRSGTRGTSSGNTNTGNSPPSAPASLPNRPTFADRYNLRRRGSNISTTTTTTEEPRENSETHSEAEEGSQNADPVTSAPKLVAPGSRVRSRVHLTPSKASPSNRPSLVNRINPHLRRPGSPAPVQSLEISSEDAETPAVTNSPNSDNASPELADSEPEVRIDSDESVTTTPPSTLNRLRNRPRLRITDKHANKVASTAPQNRKQLVSSLLPRRRPNSQEELQASQESEKDHSTAEEDVQPEGEEPETIVSTAPPVQEEVKPSLLNRKRTRRPGTIHLSRTSHSDESS